MELLFSRSLSIDAREIVCVWTHTHIAQRIHMHTQQNEWTNERNEAYTYVHIRAVLRSEPNRCPTNEMFYFLYLQLALWAVKFNYLSFTKCFFFDFNCSFFFFLSFVSHSNWRVHLQVFDPQSSAIIIAKSKMEICLMRNCDSDFFRNRTCVPAH